MTTCPNHIDPTKWTALPAGQDYHFPQHEPYERIYRNFKPIKGRANSQIVVCSDCGKFIGWRNVEAVKEKEKPESVKAIDLKVKKTRKRK